MRAVLTGILAAVVSVSSLYSGHSPASADPGQTGRWQVPFWEGGSSPYDPPSLETSAAHATAVSAVALPDGRILYWNGIEGSEKVETAFAADAVATAENSRAKILDLRSGTPEFSDPTFARGVTDEASPALDDMFCADQKHLYDGTVLITGGTEWRDLDLFGDRDSKIFDPANDTFTPVGGMERGRWYPSLVTLPDGRVGVFSGVEQLVNSVRPDPAFSQVKDVEIFDPASRTWSHAGSSPFSLPLFARLHLLPGGSVFFGGVGQTWNPFGETPDEATWALQRLWDSKTHEWGVVGPSKYGVRGGAFSVLLRLEGTYRDARILIAGGTLGPSPGSYVATTLSEEVGIRDGMVFNPGERKGPLDGLLGDQTQLRNRRWYGSGVLLPTGEVIAFSGGDLDGVLDPGSEEAVRMAELYDPTTGQWRELSAGARDRTYHNTAVLLADGRLLVGGHSPIPAHYHRHDNPLTRSNNFKDSTFEIFEPPYLFRGSRPEIKKAESIASGRRLQIIPGGSTAAAEIDELVLVRLPAVTHITDADQRAVVLHHRVNGDTLVAGLPNGGDGSVLPPGPYYLFLIRDGVPSVAKVVTVMPAGDGKVVFGQVS